MRLALREAIAGCVPGNNLVSEIVENEIAFVGLDRENGVALVVVIPDDGHQEGLAREAFLRKKLALLQRVDLAVALAVVGIVPVVGDRSPMFEIRHGLDGGVDLTVDLVHRFPSLRRDIGVRRREYGLIAFLQLS